MTYQWVDCERAFIAERYDRIAGLIGLFDRLLFLPPDLRRRAAACLNLKAAIFPSCARPSGRPAKFTESIYHEECCAGREHFADANTGETSI